MSSRQNSANELPKLCERATDIANRAVNEDKIGNKEKALELYTKAAEIFLKAIKASSYKLTQKEIDILKRTSHINGKSYLPWLDADLKEEFKYEKPFLYGSRLYPDGTLPLSDKQMANFGAWKRPCQIMSNPKMIVMISSSAIKQDIVTDCSFVASLCASAAHERKFHKKVNVVIDDLFPVSRDGTLMCTFSTNKDELWPSIIEKAYMKLMGGYNFPGSNSGIDLHTLTGWIPELIFIEEDDFDKEHTWKRLLGSHECGDVLVTISTGDDEADDVGLVPTHAYAVLDAREINGLQLLQVKNPWSMKRWTGPYSHLDEINWTPELMSLSKYDRLQAIHNDDDSLVLKDALNLEYNPQFCLEIKNDTEKVSETRILLSKHIMTTGENRDYITLHLYNNSDGKKVYYPDDPCNM
ncbi:7027_t:CDS:10, partial [Racocetra persica]